jgi:aromatic ring hydroxylase
MEHIIESKGGNKMSFDPKPVTLEEYNQSLRDTVNAYYEHAMQDPSMTEEDAIQSTAEMSEKYLDAVEEFQQEQDMQNETEVDSGIEDSEGIDNSGIDDDGMDV